MNTNHDQLPQSPTVSALVRRIVLKLNAELHFNGHKPLTDEERAALFDLGEASKILDGIACLRGMAAFEDRARRDLRELFEVFNPEEVDPLEVTQEQPPFVRTNTPAAAP